MWEEKILEDAPAHAGQPSQRDPGTRRMTFARLLRGFGWTEPNQGPKAGLPSRGPRDKCGDKCIVTENHQTLASPPLRGDQNLSNSRVAQRDHMVRDRQQMTDFSHLLEARSPRQSHRETELTCVSFCF